MVLVSVIRKQYLYELLLLKKVFQIPQPHHLQQNKMNSPEGAAARGKRRKDMEGSEVVKGGTTRKVVHSKAA
ncbi:lipopolysaccharide heptosyltransferase family protein [Sesbania bispinosa]|nr:lipopolysaccharide heptosyltransferase family protein [Sesbania bispinosa]